MATVENSHDNSRENSICDTNSSKTQKILSELSKYHPVVVEGMGYYDPRDPSVVAEKIRKNVLAHLEEQTDNGQQQQKPLLVIVQGDPLSEKGISAITPILAESLSGEKRALVCLDESIDPTHSRDADRRMVVLEVKYSDMVQVLENRDSSLLMEKIEASIDATLIEKNKQREGIGKAPLKDYYKTYALLQEVTKASLKILCRNDSGNSSSSITIAHTSHPINPFSVTSFCSVGLELGLYDASSDLVAYNQYDDDEEEPLDYAKIDPR